MNGPGEFDELPSLKTRDAIAYTVRRDEPRREH